jgi:CDP-4-dehydro-6-deoxyglucose reductase
VVLVEGPSGEFVLREDSSAPAVFVAFGAGFTQLKSLIEHAIAMDAAERLHLYRIDEAPTGTRLDNLCRAWNDSLDNFSYYRLEPTPAADAILARIRSDVPDLRDCDLYLAGPSRRIGELEQAARDGGLDAARIRSTETV